MAVRLGIEPSMPPPPICIARWLHEAGITTRKRIGIAVGLLSTGAMEPSTLQYAGSEPVAAFHTGALSVTDDTGSPMEATGMLVPSLSAVQSVSLTILLVDVGCDFDPAAGRWGVGVETPFCA